MGLSGFGVLIESLAVSGDVAFVQEESIDEEGGNPTAYDLTHMFAHRLGIL